MFQVYNAVHWADTDFEARGTFTVEESLGRNSIITVTTEQIGDVDGLQLVSPTGRPFDLPEHAEGLVFVRIPGVAEV